MVKKIWILLPLSFLLSFSAIGQEIEKAKAKSLEQDSAIVISKGRVVHKNRIYRQNASYLTMGYGVGYSFPAKGFEPNMSFSYQHFVNQVGLQIGYHSSYSYSWWDSLSGNRLEKLNDFYLGVGKRWESSRFNLAVFAGPTWSYGFYPVNILIDSVSSRRPYRFGTVGAHAEALVTYKLFYDLGIGLSLYGCWNNQYSVVGAQVHLFFSTAFVRNYD
jgi:hypothetical protein